MTGSGIVSYYIPPPPPPPPPPPKAPEPAAATTATASRNHDDHEVYEGDSNYHPHTLGRGERGGRSVLIMLASV